MKELKTTRYFEEQVLRKRTYLRREWFAGIIAAPLRRESQADGRIRMWGSVLDPRDNKTRYLRVVMLEDAETLHNAFFDRDFEVERK